MKYNNSTFWPTTNIEQYDINSINANFKLAEWEWSNLEQTESLLSFWTKYEEATSYSTAADITNALDNNGQGLLYHEGIIYSGLEVESGQLYKTINLPGSGTIKVKPGSIIYTVDLSEELYDPKRYLIIESPVKMGYNYTIQNGIISFSWGVLNTWTRPIKGPTGASNWSRVFTFLNLNQPKYKRDTVNQLKFAIPLTDIPNFTYTNAFSISFYSGAPSYANEVSIPHSAWVNYEEDPVTHSYKYFLYITFDVASTGTWRNLFSSGSYQLLIW